MAKKKKVTKACDNREFLHGRSARHLRVLAEFIEPEERPRKHGIRNTIVFFGSAMSVDNPTFRKQTPDSTVVPEKAIRVSNAHESCIELAKRITAWSQKIKEPANLKLFKIIDDVDKAFEYITGQLKKLYLCSER